MFNESQVKFDINFLWMIFNKFLCMVCIVEVKQQVNRQIILRHGAFGVNVVKVQIMLNFLR